MRSFSFPCFAVSLFVIGLPGVLGDDSDDLATRKALAKKVTVNAVDAPLRDVVQLLARQANVNILIDEFALDDVGIGTDTPITMSLKGISLRSTLRLVLHPMELAFTVRDGALVVTTRESCESGGLQLKVFDVTDLVASDGGPGSEMELLVELIESTVRPDSWDSAGGPGSINSFRGTLVVTQVEEIVEQVESLLASVRKVLAVDERATRVVVESNTPDSNRFDKAMEGTADFRFADTPLTDILSFISDKFDVPVVLDSGALDDIGFAPNSPLSLSASGLKLRQALNHLLNPVGLTWDVRDEVIQITTQEECERQLETRVYSVIPLVGTRAASAHAWMDPLDELEAVTTSAVCPDCWEDVGGPGFIVSWAKHSLMIVSQTAPTHREIERLYARLKAAVPEPAANATPNALRLVVYGVVTSETVAPAAPSGLNKKVGSRSTATPATLAQFGSAGRHGSGAAAPGGSGWKPGGNLLSSAELLSILQETVEPDTWRKKNVYGRAAAGRLIIRQTDAVHRQLQQMMLRLGVTFSTTPRAVPGWQWGGSGGSGGFF